MKGKQLIKVLKKTTNPEIEGGDLTTYKKCSQDATLELHYPELTRNVKICQLGGNRLAFPTLQ